MKLIICALLLLFASSSMAQQQVACPDEQDIYQQNEWRIPSAWQVVHPIAAAEPVFDHATWVQEFPLSHMGKKFCIYKIKGKNAYLQLERVESYPDSIQWWRSVKRSEHISLTCYAEPSQCI